jgi:hypothetical protein
MLPRSPSCSAAARRSGLLWGAILVCACAPTAPPLPALVVVPAPTVAASAPPVVASAAPIAEPAPPPPAAPLEPEPEPEPEPEAGPVLPARGYLGSNVAARFPRRAVLARGRPLSLVPGGPALGDSPRGLLSSRVEVIVVEEHPRSLRVVVEDAVARVVVFAPRTVLRVVSTRPAWLSTAPDRAPDPAAGARIAAGIELDEIADGGPLHHVRGEASRVAFEGWLADDALGVSFAPGRPSPPGHGGLVAESTAIVNAAGEILARLPPPWSKGAAPSFEFDVTPLPGAPAGFQGIHLALPEIEVNGLVPSASYKKKLPGVGAGSSSGVGMGSGGFITDTERGRIRKGAELLDEAGEPVGVVLAEAEVFMSFVKRADKAPLRWARLMISPFGFCAFHVRKADVRPLRG